MSRFGRPTWWRGWRPAWALLLAAATSWAAGVRVVEPVTARLAGSGQEVRLPPGTEYPLLRLDGARCRILYPTAPGITVEATVPGDRVQVVEQTAAERAAAARRQEQAAFAAAQRARGMVAVGEVWVTGPQAAAMNEVRRLAAVVPALAERRRAALESEQKRSAAFAELTARVEELAAEEERLAADREQLTAEKTAPNPRLPKSATEYNERVMAHNRRAGRHAQALKRQQELQAAYAEIRTAAAEAREAYGQEEQAFLLAARAAREQFLTAAQPADRRQWEVLHPYGLWLAQLTETVLGPTGPGRAASQGVWITGRINNTLELRFLVDTGASWIALSDTQFLRLGVPPSATTPAVLRLANGAEVKGRRVTLRSVAIGTLELQEVEAVVLPDHPSFRPLLGMSFLGRCKWRRGASGNLLFDAP
ncbi:MAG: retropepsin-like aspartic protease [Lentisphaeria bacterium]